MGVCIPGGQEEHATFWFSAPLTPLSSLNIVMALPTYSLGPPEDQPKEKKNHYNRKS